MTQREVMVLDVEKVTEYTKAEANEIGEGGKQCEKKLIPYVLLWCYMESQASTIIYVNRQSKQSY